MDVTTFGLPAPTPKAQPSPGSTNAGDLYVDLQSRQLWLGVAEEVATGGSILISDIVALLAADAANLDAAKAYTDAKVVDLAPLASPHFTGVPTAPTPPAADNDTSVATTAFVTAAVVAARAAAFNVGTVLMFCGNPGDIGQGVWAGWALCDGQANMATGPGGKVPDLRDRFVVGANATNNYRNTPADFFTSDNGEHTHKIDPTALTLAQIPAHNHSAGTYAFADTSTPNGAHGHETRMSAQPQGTAQAMATGGLMMNTGTVSTQPAHNAAPANTLGDQIGVSVTHTHDVSGAVTGSSGLAGSTAAHTHLFYGVVAHNHTVTAAKVKNAIAYYAIAFVVKLI